MKITSEQLKDEKRQLKETLKVVKDLIDSNSNSIKSKIDSVYEMKRYIWENTGTLDDIEVMASMYDVNQNVTSTNESIEELKKLKRSLSSPYFGRIDFKSKEFSAPVYIGINGVMKDLKNYVFDWRTPIASLFYNYGIGKASYEAPVGEIKGEISLKRQYKITNGKLERCFNSDLNIDDEYLQEILSNASSEKMTNIVNTIQKEQNEIIRNMSDKYLLVQGIAGSGKTSVALHRIAYLLYREKNLTYNNVLIFSPNEVFSEYISNVLPELGEENVLQTTFSDFASAYMDGRIESFTSFIERYYKHNNVADYIYESNKKKLSNEFKNSIDKHLEAYVKNSCFRAGIITNNKTISKEELTESLNSKFDDRPLFTRINDMAEYICETNNLSYKKNGKKVFEKLKELLNVDGDIFAIYQQILNDNNINMDEDITDISSNKNKQRISYADLLPLMYINFELYGYPNARGIKHIIIDEAQDYTLLQFDILKKIFKNASFTILGDINQTINPYYKYNDLNEINKVFDGKGKYLELNKTYRSSQEIIEFTNGILGIDNACSVRRSNSIPVEIKEVSNAEVTEMLANNVNDMKKNGIKRIAIITKSKEETVNLFKELKDKIKKLTMINTNKETKMNDTVILPSYISKGLEFDGVIAYTTPNKGYDEKDKYLFYVVCTRAQHALTVYNQKQLIKKDNK